LNFAELAVEKEALRQNKRHEPKTIKLGGMDFLLQPYGSSSGFPFVIANQDYTIAFGEFNTPSFFVKFRSLALWRDGVGALHQRFMTLATGKGGRYRYYKCNTRISKGNKLCDSHSTPMEKLDTLVLSALADKVFNPDRVKSMLSDMKKQIKAAEASQNDGLKKLTKELDELKTATERLYEAVEKGLLPLDSTLQERSHRLQARRQELLIEIAGQRRQQQVPEIKQNQLTAFTTALRSKLLDRTSGFGKEYLKLLVSEIRVKGNQAEITGSYSALSCAVAEMKMGTLDRVPTFVPNWLA
jgi:hypothetical protein